MIQISIWVFVLCKMSDMRECLVGGKEQEGQDDSNIINYVCKKIVWDIIACCLKINGIRNTT